MCGRRWWGRRCVIRKSMQKGTAKNEAMDRSTGRPYSTTDCEWREFRRGLLVSVGREWKMVYNAEGRDRVSRRRNEQSRKGRREMNRENREWWSSGWEEEGMIPFSSLETANCDGSASSVVSFDSSAPASPLSFCAVDSNEVAVVVNLRVVDFFCA